MKKYFFLIYIFLTPLLVHLFAVENLKQSQIHLSVQSEWVDAMQAYERDKRQDNKMKLRMFEYYGLLLNKQFDKTYEYCEAYFKDEYDLSEYTKMMQKQVSRYYEGNLQPTNFVNTSITQLQTEDFDRAHLVTCVIVSTENYPPKSKMISSIEDFWVLSKDDWKIIPGSNGFIYPHYPRLELKLLKLPVPLIRKKEP